MSYFFTVKFKNDPSSTFFRDTVNTDESIYERQNRFVVRYIFILHLRTVCAVSYREKTVDHGVLVRYCFFLYFVVDHCDYWRRRISLYECIYVWARAPLRLFVSIDGRLLFSFFCFCLATECCGFLLRIIIYVSRESTDTVARGRSASIKCVQWMWRIHAVRCSLETTLTEIECD